MRSIIISLLCLFSICESVKVAIFVPSMANSQVQYNARVAETLSGGGHDVTMIMLRSLIDFDPKEVKIPKGVKTYIANGIVEGFTKKEIEKKQAELIFQDLSSLDGRMMALMQNMTKGLTTGCRMLLRNKEFLHWLEAEKFDIAFSHMYNSCPIGLIHLAKIPTWIWLNSGALMDFVANTIGVPILPSYVPPMVMEAHDTMNFFERTKSFIGHNLMKIMYPRMIPNVETQIFREEIDPDFPDLIGLARKCPLVMANTNEIYDLPRPTLAKVVNIGGLGVRFDDAKPLEPDFAKIAQTGKGLIVFSFGSVAAAHEMPLDWKNSFLDAFRELSDYQFVMRYVADDIKDRLPPNVHVSKWLPQKDLLLHNNTKAFITHGGYNSLQEAISAGVPLVTVALFGDQPKNSMLAKKHGIATSIRKGTLSKQTILEALRTVLDDPSYSKNVKRLSAMAKQQPIAPSTLLLRWTQFVAEFQTLDNLVPAGQKLNWLAYHSLDVIFFLSSIVFAILFAVFFVVKKLVGCVRRRISAQPKQKTT